MEENLEGKGYLARLIFFVVKSCSVSTRFLDFRQIHFFFQISKDLEKSLTNKTEKDLFIILGCNKYLQYKFYATERTFPLLICDFLQPDIGKFKLHVDPILSAKIYNRVSGTLCFPRTTYN